MKIEAIFPTAIFIGVNEALVEELLQPTKEVLRDKTLSRNLGYNTTFGHQDGGLEKINPFFAFSEMIIEMGVNFFNQQGYKIKKEELQSYIFANEMYKGDSHPKHTHPDNIISGVFYLQTPENSAPIRFFDPRPFRKYVSFETLTENEFSQESIQIFPHKGLMLMWESWLEHSVPKTLNENESRISLVFNLYKKKL